MKKKLIALISATAIAIAVIPIGVSAVGAREGSISSFGVFEYKDGGVTKVRIDANDLKTVARGIDTVEAKMDSIYDPDGGPGGTPSGELADIGQTVEDLADAVSLDASEAAAPTNVLSGKKYITKGTDGKLTVETGTMTSYKNATSTTGATTSADPTESGTPGDPSFTSAAVVNLPAGYYDGNTPIDVSTIANHYYEEGVAEGGVQYVNVLYHGQVVERDCSNQMLPLIYDEDGKQYILSSIIVTISGARSESDWTSTGSCSITPYDADGEALARCASYSGGAYSYSGSSTGGGTFSLFDNSFSKYATSMYVACSSSSGAHGWCSASAVCRYITSAE